MRLTGLLLAPLICGLVACEPSPKTSDINSGTYRRDSGRCANYAVKNLPEHLRTEAYVRCMEGGGYTDERSAIESSTPHSSSGSQSGQDSYGLLSNRQGTPSPQGPTVVGNITVEDGISNPTYLEDINSQLKARWASEGREAALNPVVVSFTIGRDGQVRDLDILKSSGDADYDRVMVGLIIGSSPFSPPPTGKSVHLKIRL